MRKMSMATRVELVQAAVGRYVAGTRQEKHLILNEFVALTGFHRKHAMRLLRVDGSKQSILFPARATSIAQRVVPCSLRRSSFAAT
jgi:hypothetical protein